MKKQKTNVADQSIEMTDLVLNGGIVAAVGQISFDKFSENLWRIVLAATSDDLRESTEFIDTNITRLRALVRGAWYFLEHQKDMLYKETSVDRKWVDNPYRCLEAYRTVEDKRLNHRYSHLVDRFTRLSDAEVKNPTLVFDRFFRNNSLEGWLLLLRDWQRAGTSSIKKKLTLDLYPLKTYESLGSLLEAGYLVYYWSQASTSFRAPNAHLFDRCSFSAESYDDYNPLTGINWLFHYYDVRDMREDIETLFLPCCAPRKEFRVPADKLIDLMHELFCYGWLLLHTDQYPENWLDPDQFDVFYFPKIDLDPDEWRSRYLSDDEVHDIRQTLSVAYDGIDFKEQTALFYRLVTNSMTAGHMICEDRRLLVVRARLLRGLDILFLINLDLCKKRSKQENSLYPSTAKGTEFLKDQPLARQEEALLAEPPLVENLVKENIQKKRPMRRAKVKPNAEGMNKDEPSNRGAK